MTDPDVKNLRKLVKRAQVLAGVNAMQHVMEHYQAVYDAVFAHAERTKPKTRTPIERLAQWIIDNRRGIW